MNKSMRKEILTYMEELAEEFGLCLFVIRKEKEEVVNHGRGM